MMQSLRRACPLALLRTVSKTQPAAHLQYATVMSSASSPELSHSFLSVVKDHDLLKTSALIGGSWVDLPETYQVRNPATGVELARMSCAGGTETRGAIASAEAAFSMWRKQTGKQRAEVMKRWHQAILDNADDIATIMTLECGKPLAESRAEIIAGAASVEWFAEEAKRVSGDTLQTINNDRRMITIKQPVGVVGAITPWNFPMSMITRKVAPAIASGCTVVLKPSEETPFTASALAVLAQRAGLPDGVLNVVSGQAEAIGKAMLESDQVRKIGFTGSSRVGKSLMAGAATTMKRLSLELGGNAPFIVFDDADLQLAADGVVASGIRNAGQTCISANRILVQEAVYDQFAEMVADRMRALKVGNGMDIATRVGPVINPARIETAESHVKDALEQGATAMCGGSVLLDPPLDLKGGFYYQPTLLKNASIDMRIFREETFAPVIAMFKFALDGEAIKLANNTEYGLAAYFYTKDLRRAWKVAEELEYGMVGLNEVAIGSEIAPFGGVKQSGLGREQSKYGMDEYLELKYICMGVGYR